MKTRNNILILQSPKHRLTSNDANSSLNEVFQKKGYAVKTAFVTDDYSYLIDGRVKSSPELFSDTDMIFNNLSGDSSRLFTVKKNIASYKIPFNGSNALSFAITHNRPLIFQFLTELPIKLPNYTVINKSDLQNVAEIISSLLVSDANIFSISTIGQGSAFQKRVSVETVENEIIKYFANYNTPIILEELIMGRNFSCVLLEKFRNSDLYDFPIMNTSYEFGQEFHVKDTASTNLNSQEKEIMIELAKKIHRIFGLSQYSIINFTIKDGEIYLSNIIPEPSLTINSPYFKASESVGLNFDDLIEHVVLTATP